MGVQVTHDTQVKGALAEFKAQTKKPATGHKVVLSSQGVKLIQVSNEDECYVFKYSDLTVLKTYRLKGK